MSRPVEMAELLQRRLWMIQSYFNTSENEKEKLVSIT